MIAPGAKLIHVDCNANEINRSQPTDVGILCDPRAGLEALAEAVDATFSPSNVRRLGTAPETSRPRRRRNAPPRRRPRVSPRRTVP